MPLKTLIFKHMNFVPYTVAAQWHCKAILAPFNVWFVVLYVHIVEKYATLLKYRIKIATALSVLA
jgi:hypothetical protein